MGREYNRTKVCQQCGTTWDANRYDARFCSATCRKNHQRSSQRASIAARRIAKAIQDYREKFVMGVKGDDRIINANLLYEGSKLMSGIVKEWGDK